MEFAIANVAPLSYGPHRFGIALHFPVLARNR